ncbi:MAG: universal stress protein [Chthoniobacterales bacterium]|nr:universal stress protein [Chthoniobacterales bacterium]
MRLLVPIDFHDATEQVLAVVRRTVAGAEATVTLLHVAEPDPAFVGYETGPGVVRDQVAEEYRQQHRALQTHAEALRKEGINAAALLVQGGIARTIVKEAERLEADMIVMGTHGRGAMFSLVVGSVSHAVLQLTAVPVLLVPLRKKE